MDHAGVVVHGDWYMALANSLRCTVEMGLDCGLVRAAAAAALHPVVLRVFADPAGRGRVLCWEYPYCDYPYPYYDYQYPYCDYQYLYCEFQCLHLQIRRGVDVCSAGSTVINVRSRPAKDLGALVLHPGLFAGVDYFGWSSDAIMACKPEPDAMLFALLFCVVCVFSRGNATHVWHAARCVCCMLHAARCMLYAACCLFHVV